jgi:hypothetical protein
MIKELETKEAVACGEVSCVGFLNQTFPSAWGNYFSLVDSEDNYYKIINFHHENFDELFRTGVIEYPVNMKVLEKGFAMLHDIRIPNEWYMTKTMTTTVPVKYYTIHQKAEYERGIERGNIVDKRNGIVSYKIDTPVKTLNTKWSPVKEDPVKTKWDVSEDDVNKYGGSDND